MKLSLALAAFDLRPGKPRKPRRSVLLAYIRRCWSEGCHLLMFSGCSCERMFVEEEGEGVFKEPAALFPLLRQIEREGLGSRRTSSALGLLVVIEAGYNGVWTRDGMRGRGAGGMHGPMFWHVWISEDKMSQTTLRIEIRYVGFQYFWRGSHCGMTVEKYLNTQPDEDELVGGNWNHQMAAASSSSAVRRERSCILTTQFTHISQSTWVVNISPMRIYDAILGHDTTVG